MRLSALAVVYSYRRYSAVVIHLEKLHIMFTLITFALLFTVGPYLAYPVLTHILPGCEWIMYGVTILVDQVFVVHERFRDVVCGTLQ